MTKFRVAILGVVAAALMLVVALPAMAQKSHATGTTINVTAGKPSTFKFTLSASSAKAGTVTFNVKNGDSALSHDFSIAGKKTPLLAPGKSAKLTVTLKKGKYPYSCTVPGHAAGGMKGTFTAK